MTYDAICNMYVEYVIRRYGQGIIVFDGYQDGPSTKGTTHQRRTGAYAGPTVIFASDMVLKSKKDEFLANKSNKQKFINLLSDRLEMAGCTTDHATGDAPDLLIVQTTVTSAKCIPTVLVGDNTDLLVQPSLLPCRHKHSLSQRRRYRRRSFGTSRKQS